MFYDGRNLDNILSTVDAFFDREPACVFLVAYQERGGTLDQLAMAVAMWQMELRPVPAAPANSGSSSRRIITRRRRAQADAGDHGDGSESDDADDDDDNDDNHDGHNRFASTRLVEIFRAAP